MNKYIDRDKLAEFARHSTNGIDANDIMRFPTADVVEAVRCKDCIHKGGYRDCSVKWCNLIPNADFYVDDDFFCKNGERREVK